MLLTRSTILLVALVGCGNEPGAIRVRSEYTGSCPLFVKTSEAEGVPSMGDPLETGDELTVELRAGLLRVDLQTQGIACGPEPCSLGASGFETSCVVFIADAYPQTILIRDVTINGCVQPELICPVGPDLKVGEPIVPGAVGAVPLDRREERTVHR